jgi:hypothetical protein
MNQFEPTISFGPGNMFTLRNIRKPGLLTVQSPTLLHWVSWSEMRSPVSSTEPNDKTSIGANRLSTQPLSLNGIITTTTTTTTTNHNNIP